MNLSSHPSHIALSVTVTLILYEALHSMSPDSVRIFNKRFINFDDGKFKF